MIATLRTAFVFLFISSLAVGSPLRCGGDGPKPVTNISPNFEYRTDVIDAYGGVKEFVRMPQRDLMAYRNSRDELRVVSTNPSNYGQQNFLTMSHSPLAPIVDEKERFLLTSGVGFLFDIMVPNYAYQYSKATDLEPLYWNRNSLTSVRVSKDLPGKRTFETFHYNLGRGGMVRGCVFTELNDEALSLVKGQSWPEIEFYSTVPLTGGGFALNRYTFSLRTCLPVLSKTERLADVRAPVTSVHHMTDGNYAIHVDAPRENLLWMTNGTCRYFDLGNENVMVPNFDYNILATAPKGMGVILYFMEAGDQAKMAQIFGGLPIDNIRERDLALSDGGTRLFVSPQFENEKSRWLFQVMLGKVGP